MGFKLRLANPIGTIVHPTFGDVRVEVEKPLLADSINFQETVRKFDAFQPAINPITGKAILNATGQVRPMQLPTRVPLDVTLDYVSKYVRNITGFEDEHFSKSVVRDMLKAFLDERFNFKEERDMPVLDEEGNPTKQIERREVEVNFYQYIVERMMKAETYGRPLESQTHSPNTASEG